MSPASTTQQASHVALVHDWLTGMRGGERCLEAFAELLPAAPILTLIHEPGSVSEAIERHPVITSPLSRWAAARRHYRKLLPLFPWATRQLPGSHYSTIVSLSHCAAKAVRPDHGGRHICYCFTPARYLWDHSDTYLDPTRSPLPVRLAGRVLLPRLRQWDQETSAHVDRFIAISNYVAERIQRVYGRDSEVIYPPVEVDRFTIAEPSEVRDHYLIVSALAPYKGVDLAIAAFERLGKKLVIIGKGPDERRLRELAGSHVEFRGWLPDEQVAQEMARCRAFLLPCEEDFGITPLEAMASGRPVIALGRGGALETVRGPGAHEGATGMFFEEPSVDSLVAAIEKVEQTYDDFDPARLRQHSRSFDLSVFREQLRAVLAEEGALGNDQTSTDSTLVP